MEVHKTIVRAESINFFCQVLMMKKKAGIALVGGSVLGVTSTDRFRNEYHSIGVTAARFGD